MRKDKAMKTILVFLVIALFSSLAFANITSDQEYLLNRSGSVAAKTQLGTLLAKTPALLVAKYSYAVQGGSTAADVSLLRNLSDPKSYAKLPAKAVVTHVWLEEISDLTGTGGHIAVYANNAADLVPVTAISGIASVRAGIPMGQSVATYLKLQSEKTIKATISNAALTAGKFNVYIQYVISD